MTDRATLDYYGAEAAAYADVAAREGKRGWLARFAALLPAGAHVLDWGSGPGWAAAALAERGFTVDARDASPELAAEGARRYGVSIRIEPFEALDETAAYDGAWVSFSLLHAPRADLAGHLARLARALRPGAPLYLGLKEGSGETRDRLGRLYSYFGRDELAAALAAAGFATPAIHAETGTGMTGSPEPFLHLYTARSR